MNSHVTKTRDRGRYFFVELGRGVGRLRWQLPRIRAWRPAATTDYRREPVPGLTTDQTTLFLTGQANFKELEQVTTASGAFHWIAVVGCHRVSDPWRLVAGRESAGGALRRPSARNNTVRPHNDERPESARRASNSPRTGPGTVAAFALCRQRARWMPRAGAAGCTRRGRRTFKAQFSEG